MSGHEFFRKRAFLFLILCCVSSGFALDVCSNTIIPGSKGDQGEVGDTGDGGRIGKTGPLGETGLTGEMGQKGDSGRLGKTGPEGEQGQKGEHGMTGPSGLKGKPGSTCDCGRYRRVVGQMDINISKLKSAVKFVKHVVLGVKETEERLFLLVKEERKYRDALMNCRLRGGTLAMPESENATALLGNYISDAGLTQVLVGRPLAQEGGEESLVKNATALGTSCAQMASNGALSQVECDVAKYYICEFNKNK
ncbi:collectin-10 [Trichomycterus rosablanca]|uniref:collectin-10 n=1 Tax=Trichomycterus rosablanca TaxID=2290929 RepID=UPI002F356037